MYMILVIILLLHLLIFMLGRVPLIITLFPYTTLFRSYGVEALQNALVDLIFRLAQSTYHSWFLHPLRSEEHTSELQSHSDIVCRLLLEKKNSTVIVHTGSANQKEITKMLLNKHKEKDE